MSGTKNAPHRPPPSALSAARLIATMSFQRMRRGRLLRITAVILALPVAGTLLASIAGKGGPDLFAALATLYLRYLAPLLLALYSAHSVADEVQGATITYLWSRPLTRWALPLGKLLATLAVTAPALLLSLLGCYLAAMLPEGGAVFSQLGGLFSALMALLVGVFYYGALTAAFGAIVTSHTFAVIAIYVLAVDIGLGFVPGIMKTASMATHLLAIAGLYKPQQGHFSSDPELSLMISLPIVLAVSLVWLVVGLTVAHGAEYRISRE
ncbi:MAG: ABC transporter permease [Deltaproteobacteria bacterium]|nr:ABC transporter permease [Deltaproteobacteria bacterium]